MWARGLGLAMVTVAALSAVPATAGAAEKAAPIVVRAAHARAVIHRSPFGLEIAGATGGAVLRTLAAPRVAGGHLYAPLAFVVGRTQITTFTGPFSGDLIADRTTGEAHRALRVLAVRRAGRGVRLVLASDDPAGRRLVLTVAPQGGAAIRIRGGPTRSAGIAAMTMAFASPQGEAFRGFGGRHNLLDQHGQEFPNWVDQENVGNDETAKIGPTELYPNGPQGAYYVQSQFLSSARYGLLLARDELSRWRLDSDLSRAWQVQVAAPAIDVVVAPGSYRRAMATLTGLGGRQQVPPAWALGAAFGMRLPTLERTKAEGIPVTNVLVGGTDLPTDQQRALYAAYHRRGVHTLSYFRAYVTTYRNSTEDPGNFTTAVARGYVARTVAGTPFYFLDNFGRNAALIDFTNPAAVRWYSRLITQNLDAGSEGFLLDYGEQVQPGMRFHDGSTGLAVHNRYPVIFNRVVDGVVRQWEAAHPGRHVFFSTRAGYSGLPGSPAYTRGNFNGDPTSDFTESSGLASLTRDMLNRAVGGAYGMGTAIGGYFNREGEPTEELYLRWAAWSALTPFFAGSTPFRSQIAGTEFPPDVFGAAATATYARLARLHASVVPYVLALWRTARRTGVPITRPLWLDHPGDRRAAAQDQEWLLGRDVLVAPVVRQGVASRAVYVPRGCWRSPASGRTLRGPATFRVAAQVGDLPFFFRCGTTPFRPSREFAAHLAP